MILNRTLLKDAKDLVCYAWHTVDGPPEGNPAKPGKTCISLSISVRRIPSTEGSLMDKICTIHFSARADEPGILLV